MYSLHSIQPHPIIFTNAVVNAPAYVILCVYVWFIDFVLEGPLGESRLYAVLPQPCSVVIAARKFPKADVSTVNRHITTTEDCLDV